MEVVKPVKKRKVVYKTNKLKKELIATYESGVRGYVLYKEFGMTKSTIKAMLKRETSLKEVMWMFQK